MVSQAKYYGESWNTNNRAEVHALRDLMGWLGEHQEKLGKVPAIVIYGDS
jgi:ribonuclease HI